MTLSAHDPLTETETAPMSRQLVAWLGSWTAILVAVAAVAALALGVTTPPRSGPFCTLDVVERCVEYPYTDVAAYIPRDYLWMYPAILLGPLFVVLVICIQQAAAVRKTIFGQVAVVFAAIAGAVLFVGYFIQLTVMQPSLLKGEVEGLSLFSQYNPHGVFIALEDIGYVLMGAAFLFLAPLFDGSSRLERGLRLLFTTSAVIVFVALVLLAIAYGSDLEYRFEVASITVTWLTLIVGGGLLNLYFRRATRESERRG